MTELHQNFRLLKPILKGWPVILIVLIISVWIGTLYLQYATPMYESTTMIKLALEGESLTGANPLDVFSSNSKIAEEVQVLKSSMLITRVLDSVQFDISYFRIGKIRSTEMYHETPFVVVAYEVKNKGIYGHPIALTIQNNVIKITDPFNEQKTTATFDQLIQLNGLDLTINLNKQLIKQKPDIHINDDYTFVIYNEQQQIDIVKKNLDVTSVDKDVAVLRVTYKSPVARKAADMVNKLAASYISDYVDYKVKSADLTVHFIDNQLEDVSGKLANSENAIEGYRDKKGIVDFEMQTQTDLQKISDLKLQLATIQMNLTAIDSLQKYIEKDKQNFTDLTPNFEAPNQLFSTDLMKQIQQLQAERKDLLTKFTDQSDEVKVIDAKISDLTISLAGSIKTTRADLNVKSREIIRTIEEAEGGFVGLPGKEKEMGILSRNFGQNEKMYEYLNEKLTEAQIVKAANISFHRIIQDGTVPQLPMSPNRLLVMILSGFLGLLFGISGIYILDVFKARVKYVEQIEKMSSIPVWSLPLAFKKSKRGLSTGARFATELELRNLDSGGSVVCFVEDKNANENSWLIKGIISHLAQTKCAIRLIELVPTVFESNQIENRIDKWLSSLSGTALKIHDEEIPHVLRLIPDLKDHGDLLFFNLPSPVNQLSSLKLMKDATICFVLLHAEVTSLSVIDLYRQYQEQYHLANLEFVLLTKKFQLIPLHDWLKSFKALSGIFRKGTIRAKTTPAI